MDFQKLIFIFGLTGQHTASGVTIQRELDPLLLWLACRRHYGEVVSYDYWESLKNEASSFPHITDFMT